MRKNRGERTQWYVENSNPAIISREVFYRVREEMARRASKRKVLQRHGKTERGKYSAKYTLSERLVCGECGSPYKRCTWARNGKKRIVWRCVSRLEFGTKYCRHSPTLDEDRLHRAIVEAINEFAQIKGAVTQDFLGLAGAALGNGVGGPDLAVLRQRLAEMTARMGFIDICPNQQYLLEKLLPIYSKAQMGIIPPPQLKTVPREQVLAEACPAPDWNYLRWDGYSDRKYQAIRSGEGLLELEWDGKKVPLELQVRAYYCGGALALMLADWTSGEPEPWADLTVNLGGPDKKDCAFVDVNKLGKDILPWIEQNGLGSPTGRSQRSGFVVYPEYRFDSGRLKELDDEGYKVYVQLLEKRREVKKTRGRER